MPRVFNADAARVSMQDVMLDADKLIKSIKAAAWDQRFQAGDDERLGNGISLGRLLSCIRESITPASEDHVQLPGNVLVARFLALGGRA